MAVNQRRQAFFDASISAESRKGQVFYVYPTYHNGQEIWEYTSDWGVIVRENPSIHFEMMSQSRAMRKPI